MATISPYEGTTTILRPPSNMLLLNSSHWLISPFRLTLKERKTVPISHIGSSIVLFRHT